MDLASKRDDNKGSSLQQLIPNRVHTWDKGAGTESVFLLVG